MGAVLKVVGLAVFLVVVALAVVGVSAQTHHVVGGDNGWGPDLDVSSWLSGRVFSVGDKIWFKNSGKEESIVEVGGVEEFVSCNLTNPIRMYTDPLTHVVLEKEGIRYFTSGNPEMCKNGLKLPLPVYPPSKFVPDHHPSPPFDPSDPGHKSPPFDPSYDPSDPGHISPPYDPPSPPFEPYPPVKPTPPTPPHEPPPVRPPPPHQPKPVQPPPSTAPARFTAVPFMLSAGLLLCYYVGI